MDMSTSRTIRNEIVENKVLDTAVVRFSEAGYFNTSMADIVRLSGISSGSIYHHFGDKEGIAKALFKRYAGDLEQVIDEIEEEFSSTRERCRAIIEHLFKLSEAHPRVMEFMLRARHKEFLPEYAPVCSARPMVRMRQLVAIGMDNGEIVKMDANVAAAMVYGASIRLIQLRLDGLIDRPLPELMDEVWRYSWRAVAV